MTNKAKYDTRVKKRKFDMRSARRAGGGGIPTELSASEKNQKLTPTPPLACVLIDRAVCVCAFSVSCVTAQAPANIRRR